MSRFLFVSAPLPGHMDWGGMHRTAARLLARGHEVVWVTEPYGFPHLQRWGIPTLAVEQTGWLWPPPPMPKGLSPAEQARERERRAVAVWLHPDRVLPATEALRARVREWQPDVLVTEPFMAAAGFVAELERVPLVVAGWPATRMPDKVPPQQAEAARLARDWFERMKGTLGVRGEYWAPGPLPWLRAPLAHIVYFVPEWYSSWRVLTPPTYYVGGVRPDSREELTGMEDVPEERPWVLVTLGSAFTQDEAFFHVAVDAVLHAGGYPLVATGDEALAARLRRAFPSQATIRPWFSFDALFPYLSLIVHHGGMGTTHAALVHGIPQLVVPHAADQYYQAARVQRLGLGVALRTSQVTSAVMRAYVKTLVWESRWREQAQKMARRMAYFQGVPWAAEILIHLASTLEGRGEGLA